MGSSPPTETIDRFTVFFEKHYDEAISELAQQFSDEQRSLSIDYDTLAQFDGDLADNYLSQPGQMREYAEEALRLYDTESNTQLGQAHVRLTALPTTTSLTDIRSKHIHQLIQIQGTVSSTSTVRSELINIVYECQRCGFLTRIPQPTVRRDSDRRKPSQCTECERKGPFRIAYGQSEMIDVQTVVLEQQIENLDGNGDSATIELQLRDDLAGTTNPGDTICVTGVLHFTGATLKTTIPDKYIAVTDVSDAGSNSHITTTDDEERIQELATRESLFDDIIGSICPSLYGYEQAKLAIALQLVGGVPKELPDGTQVRGDIHLLFIGDTGTGKSILARAAARLAPRSVTVSGPETSSVGLTAAVTPSSGRADPWEVQGGALVRANNGLAVIDNFGGFGMSELAGLCSTIEEQEVNVNKASVEATLPARTAVFAAMNPEFGRFDPYVSIRDQCSLPPDVISQFDVFFMLTDQPIPDQDEAIADHILDTTQAAEATHAGRGTDSPSEPTIPLKLLQKYIVYAKRQSDPQLSNKTKEQFRDFYIHIRSEESDGDNLIPITARTLEAVVRLAEASARLRLSDTVTTEDADRAIMLIESCLCDANIGPDSKESDSNQRVAEFSPNNHTKNELIDNTKDELMEIQSEHDPGIPKEVAVETIKERVGVSRYQTEQILDRLRRQGDLYEPESDYYRFL